MRRRVDKPVRPLSPMTCAKGNQSPFFTLSCWAGDRKREVSGLPGRFPQWTRRAAMSDYDFKAARKEELERHLATARRVAALPVDPLSKERVDGFIQELEAELGKGLAEIGRW
jgi:hypothetical protein